MQKRLRLYGNSLVITFSNEEKEIYGLKVGDVIKLDDMLIMKSKKVGKKK